MNDELERAEVHLRHAEHDLGEAHAAEEVAREQLMTAESAEAAARRETEEALREIRTVEEECRETHFTVDGEPYPDQSERIDTERHP
jgi:chromosome segregation ATPase